MVRAVEGGRTSRVREGVCGRERERAREREEEEAEDGTGSGGREDV